MYMIFSIFYTKESFDFLPFVSSSELVWFHHDHTLVVALFSILPTAVPTLLDLTLSASPDAAILNSDVFNITLVLTSLHV